MEKPTTVDHRADIFSLGVVFYEMLTGELPLGKFAPPSSRKVEVDVRLDDVVLRALEKDPERRYQHASQVKTAVDTIAGTAAPPPPPPAANAAAHGAGNSGAGLHVEHPQLRAARLEVVERGILAVRRHHGAVPGAAGVREFVWRGLRQTRTGWAKFTLEITSAVAMLVWGPLMGGLLFYFLKKIRREPATVETAFCGFSQPRFCIFFSPDLSPAC